MILKEYPLLILTKATPAFVIVGNGKKILPNLAKLGFPVKKYDKYAEPVKDEIKEANVTETPKSSDAVSGFSIIEDYLKAIGGKTELQKVNSIVSHHWHGNDGKTNNR